MDYVGRYATSSGKLEAYLIRKLREQGWGEDREPPIDDIVTRFRQLGYIDDRAFAAMRASSLLRRGYGMRRVKEDLRHAGVGEEAATAAEDAEAHAMQAAMTFARRRRIGPYAAADMDRDAARRALSAMLRAGHSIDVARRVLALRPGELDEESSQNG
ncbi:RecX family transcriptional regulator [Flavisphingomonas formosensis]|uniref:RecX family transcriptional regulator n=1 Tax=Flavisphingomonas formosensis TaxID=861534 RepID=UPI001E321A0A|nr:RecX family transcriptional regulator [Sphingomonas formosensis]